jgi:DNA-binding transcriptional MerR regulator
VPTANSLKPLSTAEVCDRFQISRSTLFRWEREREIPPAQRDPRHANQRQYGREELDAIRIKHIRTIYRAGCRAEDLAALRAAQESLYILKIQSGDLVGLDELRAYLKTNALAPTTIKQLLRFAADTMDENDDVFEQTVSTVLDYCRRRREFRNQERQ